MLGIGKRFVYVLRSDSDPARHYVGVAGDVDERLAWHNGDPAGYTLRYRPWRVVVSVEFPDEPAAIRFEKYLKSGAGRAFAKRHFSAAAGDSLDSDVHARIVVRELDASDRMASREAVPIDQLKNAFERPRKRLATWVGTLLAAGSAAKAPRANEAYEAFREITHNKYEPRWKKAGR